MNLMTQLFTQYDPQIRKKIQQNKLSVIIPVGSIEQHGAHLPITTDIEIVTYVSDVLAQKIKALLLPTITYGVSFEHAPLFQLSVKKSTLQKQITDLCESLAANRIKNIFIINGHHGNQKALDSIEKSFKQSRVFVFSYWHFMDRDFDHGGFVETSLMLAISKNVKMRLAKKGLDEEKLDPKELAKIRKLAYISFPKAAKNGIWGDPTNATKKDGVQMLSEIVSNLEKRCKACLTSKKLRSLK